MVTVALSSAAVALKFGQGHQNWYESVKPSRSYRAKFECSHFKNEQLV